MKNPDVDNSELSSKTLFLHIGLPKTGTTAIQSHLAENAEWLSANGVFYPNPLCSVGHHTEALLILRRRHPDAVFNWHRQCTEAADDFVGDAKTLATKIVQASVDDRGVGKDIVLSSEGIFESFKSEEDIQLFRDLFPDHRIKVVLYLRRIDKMVVSALLEHTKVIEPISEDAKRRVCEFRVSEQLRLLNSLACWEKVLGQGTIIIRPFESEQLKEGDAVIDFLNVVAPNASLLDVKAPSANTSISVEATYFLAAAVSFPAWQRSRLESLVGAAVLDSKKSHTYRTKKYSLFSPRESSELLDRLEKTYKRIAREYLLRSDEQLFLASKPDPEQEWAPFEDLTVDVAMPICEQVFSYCEDRIDKHFPPSSKDMVANSGSPIRRRKKTAHHLSKLEIFERFFPKVSIITVVYNNASSIERCIESVLNQTYPNIEYIVIDGGSDDGTLDVIRQWSDGIDTLVSEPDAGIFDAMNKGLALATGEIIAFLNSDDYYLRDAVYLSVRNLLKSGADLSYAGMHFANEANHVVLADECRAWNPSLLIQGIPGGHETIFARRKCYDSVGNFDLSFSLAADYHWVTRVYRAGLIAAPLTRAILVMATGGASFNKRREVFENFRILREVFGDIDDTFANNLYELKYYNSWKGPKLPDQEMLSLLPVAKSYSDQLFEALWLTIEQRKAPLIGKTQSDDACPAGKLKIAIALTYLNGVAGGAERIAIETANELYSRGHAVTVVSCFDRAGEPYYHLDPQIPHINIGVSPYRDQYERAAPKFDLEFKDIDGRVFEGLEYTPTEEDFNKWKQSGHLWRCRVYKGFFGENQFDVVISHMPSTFPYVLLGRKNDDSTLHIAALHNAPSYKFFSQFYPADGPIDRYMRLVSLEQADKVSVIFDEFVPQMPEDFRSKCFVLPNFTTYSEKSHRVDAQPGKVILSVGRLTRQKGFEYLIRAYAHLRGQFPDWTLQIYGDGPLEEELRELCLSLNLPEDKILRGTRSNIEEVYRSARIFAIPSVFEGFGLAVVEAMAHGLPVVGFDDCEGVKYLVKNNVNGFLVERSEDAMASAIARLVQDRELCRELGESGRSSASEFNRDHSVDILERELGHVKRTINTEHQRSVNPTRAARPLKVGMFSTYLTGGAGIACLRLHKGLKSRGHESRTFSYQPNVTGDHFQLQTLPAESVLFDALSPIVSENNRHKGSTRFSASYPSLLPEQLEFADSFDVINVHWVAEMLSAEAVSFLANLGKPLVWTLHDMLPFTGGCHYSNGCEGYKESCTDCPQLISHFDDYPAQVLKSKLTCWTDDIVVVSPSRWLAECARNSKVFRNNRIEVIPNSVDTNVFRPMGKTASRRRLGLPCDCSILLFTSYDNNERRKGFIELLEMTKHLNEVGQEFHILTFGHEASELREIGLPYTCLGYSDDIEQLVAGYCAADVTILPTLEDNLPNTILESVACGTPVVAFDSGGVGDAVINDVTGFIVERGDTKALAKMVVTALGVDFRDRCRRFALEHFSLDVQAMRYERLFEELLSKEPRKRRKRKTEALPEISARHSAFLKTALQNSTERYRGLNRRANESISWRGGRIEKLEKDVARLRERYDDLSKRAHASISWRGGRIEELEKEVELLHSKENDSHVLARKVSKFPFRLYFMNRKKYRKIIKRLRLW